VTHAYSLFSSQDSKPMKVARKKFFFQFFWALKVKIV
jgi:hypothetical protein